MDRRTFVKTVPALAMMAGASSALPRSCSRSCFPSPRRTAASRCWRRCGKEDDPRDQGGQAAPAGAVEPSLGGVRREPGGRTDRAAGKDRRLGQQLPGDRPLRRPARGHLSLRGGGAPPGSRRRRGSAGEGRRSRSPRCRGGEGPGEHRLRGGHRQVRPGAVPGAGAARIRRSRSPTTTWPPG